MHLGQIGFWQTKHFSVTRSPRCLAQNLEVTAGSGDDVAGASSCAIFRRDAPTGGGGGGGGGDAVGPLYSWRINSLTKAEESSPQLGQTNFTGFCSMSGEMSNAYFAPQGH